MLRFNLKWAGLMLALFGFLCSPHSLHAQKLELSKTYDISGKAKRGYLGKIRIDEEAQEIHLVYVTKSNNRKIKFEDYIFDLDFNHKETKAEEIELERARKKYSWFGYKGEDYTEITTTVEPNFLGTLVIRTREITYDWVWLLGDYIKSTKLLEKVKPRSTEGRKLIYQRHVEYNDGSLCLISAEKPKLKKGEDQYITMKSFVTLALDNKVEQIGEGAVQFDKPQVLVYAGQMNVTPSTPKPDWFVVFAPAGGMGLKKVRDDNPGNWTYIRIAPDGSVKQRLTIPSKSGGWNLSGHTQEGDDVYLLGSAEHKKMPYKDRYNPGSKAEEYQVACIADGKCKYVKSTTLDEFEKKKVLPEGQKKGDEYKGKKYSTTYADALPNGELLITGQTTKSGKDNQTQWEDILGFHFDDMGNLVANYSIEKEESRGAAKTQSTEQQFYYSPKVDKYLWMIMEIDGIRTMGSGQKVLIYPRVAYWDYKNRKIGTFKPFGLNEKGKQEYYLNNKNPFLPIPGQEDKIIFFGEDKKGKTLWFGRVGL